MTEKFGTDFSEPAWVGDEVARNRAAQQAEYDLHIRQFALDMAVTALPSLTSEIDTLTMKFGVLEQACVRFEAILRGDA